jgi:hypothetical protein
MQMEGKQQKLYAAGRKRKTKNISFMSFQTDILEMTYENFTKGCAILKEVFNQESQHVGIRLGI